MSSGLAGPRFSLTAEPLSRIFVGFRAGTTRQFAHLIFDTPDQKKTVKKP
jgi:hypothetical protein